MKTMRAVVFLLFVLLLMNIVLAVDNTYMMMVYDKMNISTTPKYRTWDGTQWSAEQSANNVTGDIYHMILKFSPTRDQALLAVLGSTGDVQVQAWNGTTQTWGAVTTVGNVGTGATALSGNAIALYRGFDLEFETSSGNATIVYGDGTADPDYRVWNGTDWSSATNIDIPTTGIPYWIELAPHPSNDSQALITLDANVDVYGMQWTGSSWYNMGDAAAWDTSASIATKKAIDVAFEQTSGEIMFMWGDTTSTDQYYRTYTGSLSAATLLDNANAGGIAHWVKLVSDPSSSSNRIMFGMLDAGNDLNTFNWSGSAWSAVHTEHTAGAEDIVDMNFDIVYETNSSKATTAWLVYGDGATVTYKNISSSIATWTSYGTTGDDTAFVTLAAQPASGKVFSLVYEDDTSASDDIKARNYTGQAWTSSQQQIWSGPVARNLGLTRVDIAVERFSSSIKAMMVYHTQTIYSTPYYRQWDGTQWGAETAANPVNGEIRHMDLEFCPTRNESILTILGSTGEVQTQVWTGSSWGTVTTQGTVADANADRDFESFYRGFDLEYETVSGNATLVYGDGTADPNYRIWNGTDWSSETNIDIPTTGVPNYIELEDHPFNDSQALITLDANVDVYGLYWTGSAWSNLGETAVWDAGAGIATKPCIDIAFGQTSGNPMWVWARGTAGIWSYRVYNSTGLDMPRNLTNGQNGGIEQWLRLASDPSSSSNKMMLGMLDAGNDLNTYNWSGFAWSAVHTEHSAGTENILNRDFDIVYETNSSRAGTAWLVYGDSATVTYKNISSTSASWVSYGTTGDDTEYVLLRAQPRSGKLFSLVYEDQTSASRDIKARNFTGLAWTGTPQVIRDGPPLTRNIGLTKMDIAAERYEPSALTTISFTLTLPGQSPVASGNATPTATALMNFSVNANNNNDTQPCVGTTASCQTAVTPFFVLINTGNIAIKWNMTLNETLPATIVLKHDTDGNSAGSQNFTAGAPYWVVASSIPTEGSQNAWLWADFINHPGGQEVQRNLTHNSSQGQ